MIHRLRGNFSSRLFSSFSVPPARAAGLSLRDDILGDKSVVEISRSASKGLYDRDLFRIALDSEMNRLGEIRASETKVTVPNEDKSRALYTVPIYTAEKVRELFNLEVPSWHTPENSLRSVKTLLAGLDRSKLVAQISMWGCKTFSDAAGELDEVLALLELLVKTGDVASSQNSGLVCNFQGNGKQALVLPATNFPLLALKDAAYLALQGYSVTLAVQPRYFRIYEDIIKVWRGEISDIFPVRVLPLVTRQSEPGLLEAVLHVQALRFTGSSNLFRKLVVHAVKGGNVSLDYGGEISGINKTMILQGVPETHPVVVEGTHWSVVANNGELCSSTSVIELRDAKAGQALKIAIENIDQTQGIYGDWYSKLLKRSDKQQGVRIIVSDSLSDHSSVKEYWDKIAMLAAPGTAPTHDSLTLCVYGPTVRAALEAGVKEKASNLYVCKVQGEINGPGHARVGTTGAKIPESVFGGMKTLTSSLGGNHDGVGTSQWLAALLRVRPSDSVDSRLELISDLPEKIDALLDFLAPPSRAKFVKELPAVMEIYSLYSSKPAIHGPYQGQPLVGGSEGQRTSVVSLKAVKSTAKHFIVRDSVDEDLVRALAVENLQPFRKEVVCMHLVGNGGLVDPMRAFLRFSERQLGVKIFNWKSWEEISVAISEKNEPFIVPPYFYACNSELPLSLKIAVAERSGFIYKKFPTDPFAIFRQCTTTQAWAVGITSDEVDATRHLLKEIYDKMVIRDDCEGLEIVARRGEEEEFDDSEGQGEEELDTAEAEHTGVCDSHNK